jgi:hypothetical protein
MAGKGKFCPEIVEEICKYLREGSTNKEAFLLAGISHETFYKWLKTHPEFDEATKKAEIECKHAHIKNIKAAGITSWQSSAWWLERKYPMEFALKSRLEHTGADGQPLTINLVSYKRDNIPTQTQITDDSIKKLEIVVNDSNDPS